MSKKAVEEFKAIVQDEFAIALSDAEAEQHALRVLDLLWLLVTGTADNSDSFVAMPFDESSHGTV